MLSRQHRIWSFHIVVSQRTAKKCTKNRGGSRISKGGGWMADHIYWGVVEKMRTFARKVAADDETWRNNNQTWARANFSFFLYFLFQIKWHFEFFFTEKWGVDIHPIHPPCIRPCKNYLTHVYNHCCSHWTFSLASVAWLPLPSWFS